jgi:hypothetical protein
MNIDLNKLHFKKSYNIIVMLLLMFTPFPLATLIYDPEFFFKADVLKILLGTLATGPFLFIVDAFCASFWFLMMEKAAGQDNEPPTDDFDIGDQAGVFAFLINIIVVFGNLLRLKFFLKMDSDNLIQGSIKTWVLMELIFAFCYLAFVFAVIINRKSLFKKR